MLFVGKAVNRREWVEILHFETREVEEQYYALLDIYWACQMSVLLWNIKQTWYVIYQADLIWAVTSSELNKQKRIKEKEVSKTVFIT